MIWDAALVIRPVLLLMNSDELREKLEKKPKKKPTGSKNVNFFLFFKTSKTCSTVMPMMPSWGQLKFRTATKRNIYLPEVLSV